MKEIAVVLHTGFEETEAILPVDMLRRAGLSVTLVSLLKDSLKVTSSHGVTVIADQSMDDFLARTKKEGLPMAVFCPGGMPGSRNLALDERLKTLLHDVNREKKVVSGICAAPALVLGPFGLLNGKEYTCYPGCDTHEFADKNSGGILVNKKVVQVGNLITAKGAGAATEFGHALITLFINKEKADDILKEMIFTE